MNSTDGSAGDANYGRIGLDYSKYRQPDAAIERQIALHLQTADTVVNVGAGAGSYEPRDRNVTAIEPSATMRAQRPPYLATAVDAASENLPFADNSFDAGMATFTVHQWKDLQRGLVELRRVTRGPILILTCDPDQVQDFWLNEYAPEVLSTERRRYPSLRILADALGGQSSIYPVPIPLHCRDGFNEAYYGRPEKLLESEARLACSAWSFIAKDTERRYVEHLRSDLLSGDWDRRFGHLREAPEFPGSLYLLVNHP